MKRPKFIAKISQKDAAERSSETPIKSFIPHQAMNLAELIARFERGQRLNVHENFPAMSNFTRDRIEEESFNDAPPDDIHDVVDLHMALQDHEAHKKDYAERKNKAKADDAKRKQAEEAHAEVENPKTE